LVHKNTQERKRNILFTKGVALHALPPTLGLLQGWLDIGTMVILSLLCFIWAGQTLLVFCLLTFTLYL
jgi:hypothetical protein